MPEEGAAPAFIHEEHSSNAGKWIMVLLAVVFVAGTLYAVYDSRARLEKLEKANLTSATQVTELSKRVSEAEASSETLAHQLGMTKKELAQRTAQLLAEQRASERMVHQHTEQITQVSGEVAGVKSEMGGVKTDVASTRSDLLPETLTTELSHLQSNVAPVPPDQVTEVLARDLRLQALRHDRDAAGLQRFDVGPGVAAFGALGVQPVAEQAGTEPVWLISGS